MLLGLLLSGPACKTETPAPKPPPGPSLAYPESIDQALAQVLASQPRMLAVGEYHQTEKTAGVESCVRRFTRDFLPRLKGRASDLVLETWMAEGNCGKAEQVATAEIGVTTQRPEATEDELLTLLKAAKGLGLEPHILELSCADYERINPGGEVDYGALLTMTGDKLAEKTKAVYTQRARTVAAGTDPGLVVIYGGAIHNDLDPPADERAFAFGQRLAEASGRSYVELDLVVPAFVDTDVVGKMDWYTQYKKALAAGRLALITRNPSSFILVFAH